MYEYEYSMSLALFSQNGSVLFLFKINQTTAKKLMYHSICMLCSCILVKLEKALTMFGVSRDTCKSTTCTRSGKIEAARDVYRGRQLSCSLFLFLLVLTLFSFAPNWSFHFRRFTIAWYYSECIALFGKTAVPVFSKGPCWKFCDYSKR